MPSPPVPAAPYSYAGLVLFEQLLAWSFVFGVQILQEPLAEPLVEALFVVLLEPGAVFADGVHADLYVLLLWLLRELCVPRYAAMMAIRLRLLQKRTGALERARTPPPRRPVVVGGGGGE